MEVSKSISNQHQIDFLFFNITIFLWLTLAFWFERWTEPLSIMAIIFLLCLGSLPFFIFSAFRNVAAPPVLTKHTSVYWMTIALLVGTVSTDILMRQYIDNVDIFGIYLSGLELTLPLAVIAALGYGVFTVLLLRYEKKKKIVFDCSDEKTTTLKQNLSNLNLDSGIEYLSHSDLNDYCERDSLSEIDLIVMCRDNVKHFDNDNILLRAHLAGVEIMDAKEMTAMIAGHITLKETDLTGFLLGATQKTLSMRVLSCIKHAVEPVIALAMAICLMPILLLTALIVKLTSPGPALYSQTRTGYMGKQFKLIKFRSMRVDAERDGPQWSCPNDNRVTRFGALMRRTRLDELPQLWNIFKGEMSFIGPRPERPEIYRKLESEVPLFSLRTLVRPGITGWAQVNAGYAASSADSLLKLEYDLSYIQHMSVRLDIYILLKTFKVAFVGDKASPNTISVAVPQGALGS